MEQDELVWLSSVTTTKRLLIHGLHEVRSQSTHLPASSPPRLPTPSSLRLLPSPPPPLPAPPPPSSLRLLTSSPPRLIAS
jgi:hypothetical protein